MTQGLAAIPAAPFSGEEVWSGAWPTAQAQAAQKYGPIYKWVITGGQERGEYVFMVGPEANRFVLHTHRDHFSHAEGWNPLIGEVMGTGLLNMDDPDHARHRKMWNPAFTGAAMEAYLPVMHQVIVDRTRRWADGAAVDVYADSREITFDIAAAALAGFTPGPEVDHLRRLFYTLLFGAGPTAEETMESYFINMMSARDQLVARLLEMIAARRAQPADEQPHDVLGQIVRARDEDGTALTDAQVLGHLNILLVAGHETTTTLSAWVLYLLATYPEQAALVRAELDALLGDHQGPVPVEPLRAMKRLDAVVREAGRLYSPVLNVPRGVVKEFTFGGYTVPVGTPVRLGLAAGHRLPHIFTNPDRFDPDRMAAPREEDKRTPYALVTFGGGPRICIGVNFATIEIKALVAHVLRTYDLAAVPGRTPSYVGHWTAIAPDGIWLQFTPRGA